MAPPNSDEKRSGKKTETGESIPTSSRKRLVGKWYIDDVLDRD
jgi:hypothetical protein